MERLETMTTSMTLTPPVWRTQRAATPAARSTDRSAAPATPRPETATQPGANPERLSRLWTGALADEARHAEPFERMGFALLLVAAATALVASAVANAELTLSWPGLVQWVTSALF